MQELNVFMLGAFAELINFIQSSLEDDVVQVFRLRQLVILYENRISALGGEESNIKSSRLKEKILKYFP